MAAKNTISVGIKMRPLLRKEKDQDILWKISDNTIQLLEGHSEPFCFDHIFDENTTNQAIFESMAKHIVHSVVKGFNGTIFAYGQTSSGKTYTMMGDESNPGVMVLAAKEIFKEIEKTSDRLYCIRVEYCEIYNEKVNDLLNKKNQDLKIHENVATGYVGVNCEQFSITCEDDLLSYLCLGNKERTVGETNMNERSSRSHAIFRILIESHKVTSSEDEDDVITQGILNLVDLAGSERADQTGAIGKRLKEGGHINKSLLFLSNVIKQLSENIDDKYVSFRDSKLTRLLQASLGGNALTAIICTIKPTVIEETQSTLNFAMRARRIKNKPKLNEVVTDATHMKRLEGEIRRLTDLLAEERKKNESQIQVGLLEERLKKEHFKIVSSNSLHTIRSLKRRRTWCSTSSQQSFESNNLMLKDQNAQLPSGIKHPSGKTSGNLMHLTPHITLRSTQNDQPVQQSNRLSDLTEEEDWTSGDQFNIDQITPPRASSQSHFDDCFIANENKGFLLSLTPKVGENLKKSLHVVENELKRLQDFTNLENKINLDFNVYNSLKEKLDDVCRRNKELEQDRLDNITLQHELHEVKQDLDLVKARCEEQQIQIAKFANAEFELNDSLEKYKADLEYQKKQNAELKRENQEAISLQFELENNKKKARLRETELLSLLDEKDKEISKFKNSLDAISSNQSKPRKSSFNSAEKQCANCKYFESALEENEKTVQKLQEVMQEYKQLELSHQQTLSNVTKAEETIANLKQQSRIDDGKCQKLLAEIDALRAKLQHVQQEYTQINTNVNDKTAECEKLNRIVEQTKADMLLLEQRNSELEKLWLTQKGSITELQTEFAEIQNKYQNLLEDYKKLEQTSAQSSVECVRLQGENNGLQQEIEELRLRVMKAQQDMLQCSYMEQQQGDTDMKDEKAANGALDAAAIDSALILQELQRKHEELQNEYDDLSNQLMDSLQESESLKMQCEKLQVENAARNEEIKHLKLNLCATIAVESLEYDSHSPKALSECDSAICDRLSKTDFTDIATSIPAASEENLHLLNKFHEVVEMLNEIELQHMPGKCMVFRAVDSKAGACYKMQLKNMQQIICNEEPKMEETTEKSYMQGILRENLFKIVEMETQAITNGAAETAETPTAQLQLQVTQLEQQLENLSRVCDYQKQLLAASEEDMAELKVQVQELSTQLCEKSLVAEKCDEYQKRFENLQKEHAEITMLYNQTLDDSMLKDVECADKTLCHIDTVFDEQSDAKTIQELQQQCQELTERCQSFNMKQAELEKEKEDAIEQLQNELENVKTELLHQKREYKKECDRMQLEFMEKLDSNESKFRENIRNYNKDWESRKQEYEDKINELKQQLELQCNNTSCLEDTKKQLDEKQLQLVNAELCVKELQSDLLEKKEKLDELLEEKSNLEQKKQELLNMQHELKQNLEAILSEQAQSQQRISELQNMNTELQQDLAVNKTELQITLDSKMLLQKQLQEVNEEKLQLVRKLHDIQSQPIEDFSKIIEDLRSDKDVLNEKLKNLNINCEQLKQQLTCNEDKLAVVMTENTMLEKNLLALKIEKQNLITNLDEQTSAAQTSIEESERLKLEIAALKTNYEKTVQILHEEKQDLQNAIEKMQADNLSLQEKQTDLLGKLDVLQQQLHEAIAKVKIYDDLSAEHEQLQKTHKETETQNTQYQVEIAELKSCNLQATELIKQLEQSEEACKAHQKETESLQSCLKESAYRLHTLQDENTQLSKRNSQLQDKCTEFNKKVAECELLQKQLQNLQTEFSTLQDTLKNTMQEAGNCSKHFTMQIELQKKSIAVLETKEANYKKDKIKLEGTISCLLSEKQNLEDKLYAMELVVKKLEVELQFFQKKTTDGGNNTLECNVSVSPRARNSLDRHSIESAQGKKMLHETAERKNRRLSTHDERRRQTCWKSERDMGTMTDPFDKNCNCAELDQKLKQCETNLFIRESQLETLKMEVKANPLKTENAKLIARLQDEQLKFNNEQKRYRQYIHELKAKLSEKNQSLQSLQTQHEEAQKCLVKEQQNIDVIKAALAAQKEAYEQANAVLNAEKQKYQQAEIVNSTLKDACEKSATALAVEKRNTENATATVNTLKAELEKAQVALACEKRNCDNVKAALDSQKERFDNALAALAIEKQNYQTAKAIPISLENALQKANADLNIEKRNCETAKAALAAKTHELKSMQKAYDDIKAAYANEKQVCEEANAKLASKIKELKEVTAALVSKRQAFHEIKIAYANEKLNCENIKDKLASQTAICTAANEALAQCQKDLEKAKQATDIKTDTLPTCSTNSECERKMSYEKLEGRYKDLMALCRSRLHTIKCLEEKLKQTNGESCNQEPQDANKKCMCDVLKSKYTDLELRYKIKTEKCTEFEKTIIKQKHEIARLSGLSQQT